MQVLGNLHIELNKKSFIITKVKTLGDKEASEGSVHRWFSTVRSRVRGKEKIVV